MPVQCSAKTYTGRFAPSPTGPLHFGSLVAALASYIDAKSNQGRWLLRIEDIDPPREIEGATEAILTSLEKHGLHHDGEVLYQHTRSKAYEEILDHLMQRGLIFACTCSRQMRARGETCHCATKAKKPDKEYALKLALEKLTNKACIAFDDLFYHRQVDTTHEEESFVLKRKDGLYAYQLAVVADDIYQGISHVIRGSDLLSSTNRQILLFNLLDKQPPQYGHIPVVLNKDGQKLSKQNQASPLIDQTAAKNLVDALVFLEQKPPAELSGESIENIINWGIKNWSRTRVTEKIA